MQGLEEDEAHDPEYLESIRDVVERLTVGEGETKSHVRARVMAWANMPGDLER